MSEYHLLEHTADVRIFAEGKDYQELFQFALEGLCKVIKHDVDNSIAGHFVEFNIQIESIDISALIIDFLSEALSLMHTHKCLLTKVKFDDITDKALNARLYGYAIDEFDDDVKAVTYHDAYIKVNSKNEFEVTVLLDI